MKFSGGCIGKALMAVFCIILGFVLCFASIGLAGYIVLTKKGMIGTIADKAGESVPLNFSDETKAMSIMDWGKELFAGLKNVNTGTIGELESLAGVDVISKAIEKVIGVPASIIKGATLENLAATISENLTMENAKTKFGIQFYGMPIFNDEAFLASPLASALSGFNNYNLNQVITIAEDGNAILKKLGNTKISALGKAETDTVIKSITMGEMMTINSSSSKVLQALKYNCIESQYELNELGEQVYKKVKFPLLDDANQPVLGEDNEPIVIKIELIGINDRMNTMIMSEVVEITEASNVILRKMRSPTEQEKLDGKTDLFGTEDLKLNELGGVKLTTIIKGIAIGELITIDQDSGALNLIPADTILSEIPAAMTSAMLNSTVATLKNKKVLSEDTFDNVANMKIAQRAFIYNSNMSDLLGGMINFIAAMSDDPIDPDNFKNIRPTLTNIEVLEFDSLTAFVDAYGQYNSLSFDGSVTITINETLDANYYSEDYSCYLIPIFNILTDNIDINFVDDQSDPVIVKFAVFDNNTTIISRNQCGYYYSQINSTLFEAIADTIEFEIAP